MSKKTPPKEVLVAILKEKSDLGILREQGWYRVPVETAPQRWPPKWLAFYQPSVFGSDAFKVRYYGEVDRIEVVKRSMLFPNEIPSALSEKEYYRLTIKELAELSEPIPLPRPRRLVFIPTTWEKFVLAEQINDLFDNSHLEDLLWAQFKRWKMLAERQWWEIAEENHYFLDFALFCNQGRIDVETDGDTWHAQRKRIPLDNQRDNTLQAKGWHVLRFSTRQIQEEGAIYCLRNILKMVNKLGGLNENTLIPRKFYPEEDAEQRALFEKGREFEPPEEDSSPEVG